MPHYVLELKRTARTPEGGFAVYSTIVDNLITVPMSARDMRNWLVEHEYDSWLKQGWDTLEDLIEKYGEATGRSIHEHQQRTEEWFYWHEEEEFTFGKESDAYFCLPRSMWRCN